MTVTVVILTLNEARHIERALRSVAPFATRCVVVDSGSTDDTAERAVAWGAQVLTHPFVNQAQQFNWALDQLPEDTGWVFRLDADEVVSPKLAAEIVARLYDLPNDVAGLTVPRRIAFLGRPIRYGGVFPVHIVRLMRHGRGRSEERWMDEHIRVDGSVEALAGELLDNNLNPLGCWIDKHNRYASREALEMLLAERRGQDGSAAEMGRQAATKRWIKSNLYGRLPIGLRALTYFLYRYLLRGGFRDGYPGLAFHVLQGFWYRFLVDAKLYEARQHLSEHNGNLAATARAVLDLDIDD
ncbi:glycosyltransferase involved in cell wall biosynthesis [Roseinatronobacter thiooxidans]|uniref:Glycosyltransferase involved in cell wall biosynthesis n=1 Tax=Roseinatronobacter thiooxidans TaxID=121821 RepID=A0A2W7QVX6_9RHOB|nr:glycosyltransferase family 2 protein [Roseinatronobacter thiooxidans]PZX45749.1 glycosyltransferase involved in cell wall biosynthesis [Roseinatronobacter thiooxidans]